MVDGCGTRVLRSGRALGSRGYETKEEHPQTLWLFLVLVLFSGCLFHYNLTLLAFWVLLPFAFATFQNGQAWGWEGGSAGTPGAQGSEERSTLANFGVVRVYPLNVTGRRRATLNRKKRFDPKVGVFG